MHSPPMAQGWMCCRWRKPVASAVHAEPVERPTPAAQAGGEVLLPLLLPLLLRGDRKGSGASADRAGDGHPQSPRGAAGAGRGGLLRLRHGAHRAAVGRQRRGPAQQPPGDLF